MTTTREQQVRGYWWLCGACGAQNSREDGECQFCACGGLECKRDNCSTPEHFHADHVAEAEPEPACPLCQLQPASDRLGVHAVGCVCELCSVVRAREEA